MHGRITALRFRFGRGYLRANDWIDDSRSAAGRLSIVNRQSSIVN